MSWMGKRPFMGEAEHTDDSYSNDVPYCRESRHPEIRT